MSTATPPAVIPLYVKIATEMRDQILDGTYPPGSLLPSRNEITQMYDVSAITARDALSIVCQEGLAKAVRGRGHIVRRQRSRMTVPSRLYDTAGPSPGVALNLRQVDVYQETPPDNIALPLESGDRPVWVRRAVWAAADRQPVQIHVSWISGLSADAEDAIRDADPAAAWPQSVQKLTGRSVTAVVQHTRARRANPFEAKTLGLTDGTTVVVVHLTLYDDRIPVEHSRWTWPIDAVRISDYYSYPGRSPSDDVPCLPGTTG